MSYTILYRSMFVKLSDGRYIPMVEFGDNNVYECSNGRGRGRRARNWFSFVLDRGKKFFSKEDVVSCLDEWRDSVEHKMSCAKESDDEWSCKMAESGNFGYFEAIQRYGKSVTKFKDIKSVFMGGIKHCISFDDAVKKCGLCITYWEKRSPKDGYFACQRTFNFSTEEEMFSFINEKFGDNMEKFHFMFKSSYVTEYFNECA